jgi:hypothetical protein
MSSALSTTSGPNRRRDRWVFLRDVLVFQGKLLLSNLRDIALMPVSLIAAAVDLFLKGKREGALFYQVLRWSAHSEEVIGVYSAIQAHDSKLITVNPNYTVDAMIARLEGVLVRECEKGGTAATVKAAMDRAFDQIHNETSGGVDRAKNLVARARLSMQDRFGPGAADRGEE